MAHETALIATLAAGFGLAFVFGLGARRLRLPPLVGYLLAGVLLGPFTPGFVADPDLSRQLAEVGIILLMFGVGIHFSVADLLSVKRIAVPGALVQIVVATALGALIWHGKGWPWGSAVVFGLCLSVASTVVLLRALEDRGVLATENGRIAVGWLIVEDLATVLVLVLLPALAVPLGGTAPEGHPSGLGALATIGLTLAKISAFVAVMIVVGRRAVPWLLRRVARTGSRELFTLSVLAIALGIAVGAAELFGVSFALGAFFAGTVVNGSELSHEAATEALPLQDAFSVLFFVSVGMLFDPRILVGRPLEVLTVVLIVMVGKSLGALLIVLVFRYPLRTALTLSASLAQIGEFSFILAALGVELHLLPAEGQGLVVAGALISITLNPLAFSVADRLCRSREGAKAPPPDTGEVGLRGHLVIVGLGRVGSLVAAALEERSIPFVAVEEDRALVEALRARGIPAVLGDATEPGVLRSAGISLARLLVLCTPEPFQARAMLEQARAANPSIEAVARAQRDDEREELERLGVGRVLQGDRELAFGLAQHAMLRMGCTADEAVATIESLRRAPPL